MGTRTIRLPHSTTVHIAPGFERIIDHPDFQRLRRVRQLGPTYLVYPGAVHTRFEHSLGVYQAAQEYLDALSHVPAFRDRVTQRDSRCLLAAALLHDVGHYPYAHSLEAIHAATFRTPRHEDLAAALIRGEERGGRAHSASLGDVLASLDIDAQRVANLVALGPHQSLPALDQLLASIINSAIDADKLDYLERDSVHMGVPYGRMPDRPRLLQSLTVNQRGDRIALAEKGRVMGEIFLFCRYLMFSEAYWHRTVRAASAMVEVALADYVGRTRPSQEAIEALLLSSSDDELLATIAQTPGSRAAGLLGHITQDGRRLYKRVLTLNRQRDDTDVQRAYEMVFALDVDGQLDLAQRLRRRLEMVIGRTVPDDALIIDTPPTDKDHMDSVEVVPTDKLGEPVALESVSTVLQGIARDFVKVVKRIRVFVSPEVRDALSGRERAAQSALLDEILTSQIPNPSEQPE